MKTGHNRSSLNALTHAGCTPRVIVKDEHLEEFDALHEWWVSHYDYDEARPLLEEAVLNEWLLMQAQRNYLAVAERLGGANEWTPEQFQRLALITRQKTAAERSFHRSLVAVERFRRVRVYERFAEARLEAQTEERKRRRREEDGAKKPKEPKEPTLVDRVLALPDVEPVPTMVQHVHVTQEGDDTVTKLTPSNEQLLARAETMNPQPVRVIRKLLLRPWLALEYEWAEDGLPGSSEVRTQVMTFEEWLRALEREKDIPGGHLGPVERDPTWVDDWLKEVDDGKAGKEKDSGRERRTEGGGGAMGGGADPEREDRDGTDAGKRPTA